MADAEVSKKATLALPDRELWVVSGEDAAEGGSPQFRPRGQRPRLSGSICPPGWSYASSYVGFGVQYIEAMACGTPVVATYNDGRARRSWPRAVRQTVRRMISGSASEILQSLPAHRDGKDRALGERARNFDWPGHRVELLAAFTGRKLGEWAVNVACRQFLPPARWSVEEVVRQLARTLARIRHDVIVLTTAAPHSSRI